MSPTEKQIKFVDAITEALEIDFPQSSKEFTKRTYCRFIEKHYPEFKRFVEDINSISDLAFEDEMSWFQMLNG